MIKYYKNKEALEKELLALTEDLQYTEGKEKRRIESLIKKLKKRLSS
jgi:hypothetical protein